MNSMNSTWLLLNTCRRRLWVCLFVQAVGTFCFALGNIRIERAGSVLESVFVSLVFATFLGAWACSSVHFNAAPFPMGARQRAWFPLVGIGLVSAAGGVAILAALLCLGVGSFQILDGFLSALPTFPLYVLGILMVFRVFRTKIFLVGFIGPAALIAERNEAEWLKILAETYPMWWPFVMVGIASYLYEAPILMSRRDRLLAGPITKIPFLAMPDWSISSGRHFATGILDTVEIGIFLTVIVAFVFYFILGVDSPLFLFEVQSVAFLLVTLFLGFCYLVWIKVQYQSTSASGFGSASTLGLTMMQMTLVLYPLTQALGVKKGILAKCDQCRGMKFLWATHCPHCGNPGTGTISTKALAQVAEGKPCATRQRGRFFWRLYYPFMLFLTFGVFGNPASRTFVTHSATLHFYENVDLQTRERVRARVKELVEGHPDLETWIASENVLDGSALLAPEKFRLEVEILENGGIQVSGHGLRWDPAQALPEAMAKWLAAEIEEASFERSVELRESTSSAPIFRTRWYLDNRVHWVEVGNF